MKVLFCGSRTWTDRASVKEQLDSHMANGLIYVIHGNAPGLDTIADKLARMAANCARTAVVCVASARSGAIWAL